MVHIIFPNDFDPHEDCIYELKKKSYDKLSNKSNCNDSDNKNYESTCNDKINLEKLLFDIKHISINAEEFVGKSSPDLSSNEKKEKISKLTENKKKIKTEPKNKNEAHMYKYHNDETYRRKILDKQKEYKKIKFDTDPEYKRKCLDRTAASIKKKKNKEIEQSYKNGLKEGLQMGSRTDNQN